MDAKQYNTLLKEAKQNSRVYRGFRYYTFGETYFCHEADRDCEFWFHRVCTDCPEPEKYIDDNFTPLSSEAIEVVDTINRNIDEFERQKTTILKSISKLKTLKFNIISQYKNNK